MGKRDEYIRQLQPLIDSPSIDELKQMLLSGSNLPGPRGNLELAAAFADCFAVTAMDAAKWGLLYEWAGTGADRAPTNDPQVFLPFCALEALGALYKTAADREAARIVATLKRTAKDDRWRLREAVAMAFQHIGEDDFGTLKAIFEAWLPEAGLAERRAIIAALAHPPILKSTDRAVFCLDVTDTILAQIRTLDSRERKTDEFSWLKKGLEYAISVFVAHAPEQGFAVLKKWAGDGDPDIKRIIKVNLTKARLTKKYSAQVNEVQAVLETAEGV